MKAKISRGGGFRGALAYVHDKVGSERVGGNMSGQTVSELTREFGITKKLRPDCKNPVWHCSLALPKGERVSPEKWGAMALDFMREMGMDPSIYMYDVQRHSDTEYDHIHIVASRIGLNGQLWHGQNDVFKAVDATQRLEKMHGLTLTPGFDPEHKKERKSLTAAEINMGVRMEAKPPRQVCQEAIDAVLRYGGVISAPEFIRRLESFGVRAVPSVASTGTMNGFSFETEGIPFTGSKLGESYKWKQLQTRGIEYVKDRDFEELANARRLAGERIADTGGARPEQPEARPGDQPGQELGAVAGAGGRPGEPGIVESGPADQVARPGADSTTGVRQDRPGAADDVGRIDPGDGQSSGGRDAGEGGGAGRVNQSADLGDGGYVQGRQNLDGYSEDGDRENLSIAADADPGSDGRSDSDADGGASTDTGSGQGAPERVADVFTDGRSGDVGGAPSAGWSSRSKVAGRKAPAPRVSDADRIHAKTIDPTDYLESQGYQVRKEGRHLSVRQHGDEVYRATRKDDGHFVFCDSHENGVGDSIALVQELEPGITFSDAVYRLAGAPSVTTAMRPAPAPQAPRPAPTMPPQSDDDVRRGREYLSSRGISLETVMEAEKAGMLRYAGGGVLFVGRDESGAALNVTKRAIDASAEVQKRDLRGTDKRHPQHMPGATDTVLIVEGGVDALAAVDIAKRKKRPAPTVLVSGGANVRSWIETPWVQKILRLARRVIVAFERESAVDVQARTDAAHELQIQRLQEVCAAAVEPWHPPPGVKDMAALNLRQRNAGAGGTGDDTGQGQGQGGHGQGQGQSGGHYPRMRG